MRIFYFAGYQRHVVPAVVGPQSAKHRSPKAGKARARGCGDALASATAVTHREMRPVSAWRQQKRTDTNQYHQADLDSRQYGGHTTADFHCRAIDERHDHDGCQRYNLQMAKRNLVAEQIRAEVLATKASTQQHVQKNRKANTKRSLRTSLTNKEGHPAIEKGPSWSVGFAQKNVFAAGVGHHGSELGIGECARKRQQASNNVHQQH